MSDRLDILINSSAQDHLGEGSTMFLSTAILDHDQKELLKKHYSFIRRMLVNIMVMYHKKIKD